MQQVELSRGPMIHLIDNKPRKSPVEAMPLRNTSANRVRQDEEARSVHTDRHYDKSARSNRSQDRSAHSNRSQEGSVRSTKSRDNSQNDNKSQRSVSPNSTNSGSYIVRKVSSSLVSNPDNLICDDCLNNKQRDHNKDRLDALRAADKEHADRTNANAKKQLEEEKQRHLAKLKLYKDGIEDQNHDLKEKRAKLKQDEEAEKKRILKQLADRSDITATEQKMQERKDKFREELGNQLNAKEQEKHDLEKAQIEKDRKLHNLLIDDGWREPHKKALKNHYKENLLNQLDENEKTKQADKDRKRENDANYIQDVKAYNQKDRDARAQIESEKKDLLKNELDKQLRENDEKRQHANDLKNKDDDLHRNRVIHDNEVFRDNLERKKNQVQGYLKDLTGQAKDKEDEKRKALEDAKKPEGTGLHIPQKLKKCYNCAHCKRTMALERLNKRYHIKK